jgi:hypothetical protein
MPATDAASTAAAPLGTASASKDTGDAASAGLAASDGAAICLSADAATSACDDCMRAASA